MSFTLILIVIIALLTAAIFAVNSIGGAMHRRGLGEERERGEEREIRSREKAPASDSNENGEMASPGNQLRVAR